MSEPEDSEPNSVMVEAAASVPSPPPSDGLAPGLEELVAVPLRQKGAGAQPAALAAELQIPEALGRRALLIVDDNGVTRTLMVRRLEACGIRAEVATTGHDALAMADPRRIALLLLDLVLPDLDGFAVLALLRERFSHAELPVVMVTSRESSAAVVEALRLGANDYVTKQAPFEVVLARIGSQLSLSRALESLAQAQRLESLGQLAGGIAHEINTPIQYIGDNVAFLGTAAERLLRLAERSKAAIEGLESVPELLVGLGEALEASRLGYWARQVPSALAQAKQGLDAVAIVVQALRRFAEPARESVLVFDLHESVQHALTLCRSLWAPVAEVETAFASGMPLVPAEGSSINQVLLNVIANAAEAIARLRLEEKRAIRIATGYSTESVWVRVQDEGPGIAPEVVPRIFDPFFSTREVGSGMGQGLAFAHAVVVKQHRGTIDVETKLGKGTTFTLRLPLRAGVGSEAKRGEALDSGSDTFRSEDS